MKNETSNCVDCNEPFQHNEVVQYTPCIIPTQNAVELELAKNEIIQILDEKLTETEQLIHLNTATSDRLKGKLVEKEKTSIITQALYEQYINDLKELIQKRKQYTYELLEHKNNLELRLFHLKFTEKWLNVKQLQEFRVRYINIDDSKLDPVVRTLDETIRIEEHVFSDKQRLHYYQRDYANINEIYRTVPLPFTDASFPVVVNRYQNYIEQLPSGVFELTKNYMVFIEVNRHTEDIEFSVQKMEPKSKKYNFAILKHYVRRCYNIGEDEVMVLVHREGSRTMIGLHDLRRHGVNTKHVELDKSQDIYIMVSLLEKNSSVVLVGSAPISGSTEIGDPITNGLTLLELDNPKRKKQLFSTIRQIKEVKTTHDNCIVFIDHKFVLRLGNTLDEILIVMDMKMEGHLNFVKKLLFIGTDNRIIVQDHEKRIVQVI